MKSTLLVALGLFLLLGGLIASELTLHVLTKHIPTVSPSHRGWNEPDFYRLSRDDSNAAHQLIVFLKIDGIVCLIGFMILYYATRPSVDRATSAFDGGFAKANE